MNRPEEITPEMMAEFETFLDLQAEEDWLTEERMREFEDLLKEE